MPNSSDAHTHRAWPLGLGTPGLGTMLKQLQVSLGLGTWSVVDRTTGMSFPTRPGLWGEMKPILPSSPYGVLGERAKLSQEEICFVLRSGKRERRLTLSRRQAEAIRQRLREDGIINDISADLPDDFPQALIE